MAEEGLIGSKCVWSWRIKLCFLWIDELIQAVHPWWQKALKFVCFGWNLSAEAEQKEHTCSKGRDGASAPTPPHPTNKVSQNYMDHGYTVWWRTLIWKFEFWYTRLFSRRSYRQSHFSSRRQSGFHRVSRKIIRSQMVVFPTPVGIMTHKPCRISDLVHGLLATLMNQADISTGFLWWQSLSIFLQVVADTVFMSSSSTSRFVECCHTSCLGSLLVNFRKDTARTLVDDPSSWFPWKDHTVWLTTPQ